MNTGVLIELARRFFRNGVEPEPEQVAELVQADAELPASVARAIEHAQAHERHGDDEEAPRVFIQVAGRTWLDGHADAAQELKKAFPTLKDQQAETGARFLRQVMRKRRQQHRSSGPNWVTESCRDPWG